MLDKLQVIANDSWLFPCNFQRVLEILQDSLIKSGGDSYGFSGIHSNFGGILEDCRRWLSDGSIGVQLGTGQCSWNFFLVHFIFGLFSTSLSIPFFSLSLSLSLFASHTHTNTQIHTPPYKLMSCVPLPKYSHIAGWATVKYLSHWIIELAASDSISSRR